MKNSMISDKAAVYAISKEDALTRLSAEYDALFTQKRLSEARGVGVRTDGTVGLTKYRKSSRYAADGGWSVVCTRCGRVGERGSTQIDAKARWNAHRFRYGPLKEEDK